MIKHVCAGLTALFFAALSLQAENKVVKLPRVVATNTASVEIKQIELSDTATVLDMGAWYRPHYWIRISKDTYLRGDDGKKYPVRFGSGIKLDTEFWMPDSGTASFKLHFPALPKSVKSFDFIESDCEDCFKIYGVSLQGDTPVSVPEDYRSAEVAPVFFGSALNNFGVQELLNCFVEIAPSPRPTKAEERMVEPEETKFTGFIFKITANIDPNHRSCIAFCKVCSGRFERNHPYLHVRLGKTVRFSSPTQFMAQRKSTIDEAWPGDIVGLPDNGGFAR